MLNGRSIDMAGGSGIEVDGRLDPKPDPQQKDWQRLIKARRWA
jgi:hypothetical protein